ncbi:MAG: molybdopterin-synthase adenylyltransferase MoeB [Alphaproteobacteria bacterium]|nr:molybdopterin-synthase adenylyltransferase MoeB [Alphaproteobacteria bacterium]
MDLTEEQIQRYARHILLPEVGGIGQAKLLASRVLVVGAGGLGSPLLLYLAAAGVGTLGVVDHDRVDLSNLQRQVIHATDQVGNAKVASAALTVRRINPDVRIIRHPARIDARNVGAIVAGYDLVADGTDNFATHYLMNDACYFGRKPLVAAALGRYDGQLATYKAYLGGANPCYRCLYSAPPPPGMVPSCAEAGVLGAVAGVMGTLQATEVLKELLGIGESLSGKLLIYDALDVMFRKITLRPDPGCALCGPSATITDLSAHAHAAAHSAT